MNRLEAARILGVRLGASEVEILSAYRSQLRKEHPDVGGSGEALDRLNEARASLLTQSAPTSVVIVKRVSWLRRKWRAMRRPPRVE